MTVALRVALPVGARVSRGRLVVTTGLRPEPEPEKAATSIPVESNSPERAPRWSFGADELQALWSLAAALKPDEEAIVDFLNCPRRALGDETPIEAAEANEAGFEVVCVLLRRLIHGRRFGASLRAGYRRSFKAHGRA